MKNVLDKYSDSEIKESFDAVFCNIASYNRLNSYDVVPHRDDETGERQIKIEVPGMCESPSIEEYQSSNTFSSVNFNMVVDGKQVSLVLKEIVRVNDREYTAIYIEGSASSDVKVEDKKENSKKGGISISLT